MAVSQCEVGHISTGCGKGSASGRADLARHLRALRFGLLRSGDGSRRMRAESVRGTGVTYVSGIIRYPCVRNGPLELACPERFDLPGLLHTQSLGRSVHGDWCMNHAPRMHHVSRGKECWGKTKECWGKTRIACHEVTSDCRLLRSNISDRAPIPSKRRSRADELRVAQKSRDLIVKSRCQCRKRMMRNRMPTALNPGPQGYRP